MQQLAINRAPVSPIRRPREVRLTILASGQSRWPAFVVSLALHLLSLLGLPTAVRTALHEPREEAAKRNERIIRTLRIRIPEQLYIAASGPAVRPKKTVVFRKQAPSRAARTARAGTGTGSGGRRRARMIELPPLPLRPGGQTLLQPRHAADMLPSKGLLLPEMFFWAPPPPTVPVKPFVQPGHLKRPEMAMRLDAPPKLEVPGLDAAALALAVAESAGFLTFSPPPAAPIRTTISDAPSGGAVADPTQGDPTNVLSLTAESLPLREYVTVPPGNQVAQAAGGEGAVPGLRAVERATPSAGSGAAPAEAKTATTAPSAAPAPSAAEPEPEPEPPARAKPALSPAVEATRIEHPSNGVFDIVVQSGGPEGFPESAGVLSGKPVYSVYLRVGGRKDWLLQYCLPAADVPPPQAEGGVVRLGGPTKLAAPFPLVTYRPYVRVRAGSYLLLHGYVSAAGRFEELRVLGAHDPYETDAVVAVLGRWEFRPANQNGTPSRVEILLAIPPE